MTVPLGPYSTFQPLRPEEAPFLPATLFDHPPPNPPDPPALPDVDNELYTRMVGAHFPGSVVESATLQAKASVHRERDALVQNKLDEFLRFATASYDTPAGPARVSVAFRYADSHALAPPQQVQDEVRAATISAGYAPRVAALIQRGRANPEQIRAVTQELINRGDMPAPAPPRTPEEAVRHLMFDYRIGLDCAGYVIQAFQSSRQGSAVPVPQLSREEGLDDLEHRGFARVSLDETRPGDIVSLGPPPGDEVGHRLIVYASRDATEADRTWLDREAKHQAVLSSFPKGDYEASAAATAMTKSPNLRVIVLDSSWGSNHTAVIGGVQRLTWVHDPTSGLWAGVDVHGMLTVGALPYGHPIIGAFRPRSEM